MDSVPWVPGFPIKSFGFRVFALSRFRVLFGSFGTQGKEAQAGMYKRRSVMLPLRMPRLDGTKSLRYLPRRVVQAMADHASANLLIGERTVPGRFVVLRLAADEVEREELERQFAESYEVILQEIAREAKARDFRLRGELAVRLRTFLPVNQGTGVGKQGSEGDDADTDTSLLTPDPCPLSPD